jgi:hypothetical protein
VNPNVNDRLLFIIITKLMIVRTNEPHKGKMVIIQEDGREFKGMQGNSALSTNFSINLQLLKNTVYTCM